MGRVGVKRYECGEGDRHKARRHAEMEVGLWLLDYMEAHGLSDIDMLAVLANATQQHLRHLDRDDEERRTGFRHRLAGE